MISDSSHEKPYDEFTARAQQVKFDALATDEAASLFDGGWRSSDYYQLMFESKLKKPHKRERKKYVSVLCDDGHIKKVLYDKIIEHENAIIDDNLGYGYLHNYTSQELSSYQKEAYADLKELKRQLREYPGSVIKEDPTTEHFVLAYPNS